MADLRIDFDVFADGRIFTERWRWDLIDHLGIPEYHRAFMAFTEDVYAPVLLRGDRLPAEREREVADELSEFWGLSAEHILEHHLRIDLTDFRQNILKDEGKICGRLDMSTSTRASSPSPRSPLPSATCTPLRA